MWVFALVAFVIAVLCVVVFVHGAATAGTAGRSSLDIGREDHEPRHRDAA